MFRRPSHCAEIVGAYAYEHVRMSVVPCAQYTESRYIVRDWFPASGHGLYVGAIAHIMNAKPKRVAQNASVATCDQPFTHGTPYS